MRRILAIIRHVLLAAIMTCFVHDLQAQEPPKEDSPKPPNSESVSDVPTEAQEPPKEDFPDPGQPMTLDQLIAHRRTLLNHTLADKNKSYSGKLTPLIDAVAERARANWYVRWAKEWDTSQEARIDFELYEAAVVDALVKSNKSDGILGFYSAAWLAATGTPETFMYTVGPHIHQHGRLAWLLEENSEFTDYLERVGSASKGMSRSFAAYAHYLFHEREVELIRGRNETPVIKRMFVTDCALAMETMLPHFGNYSYNGENLSYYLDHPTKEDNEANRHKRLVLQLIKLNADVRANREWYRVDRRLPEERIAPLRKPLKELTANHTWWIRLYVMEVMRQVPPLADAEVARPLLKDEKDAVRQSAAKAIAAAEAYANRLEPRPIRK